MLRKLFQRREAEKKEQREAQRKAEEEFNAKLLEPQFAEIERAFGKPISVSLRSIYENPAEIRKSYITKVIPNRPENEWIFIACYFPLHRSQAEGGWKPDGVHYAFAGDGSGSEWVVDPTDDDAVVKFLEHETCELILTGVTIRDFLGLEEVNEEC